MLAGRSLDVAIFIRAGTRRHIASFAENSASRNKHIAGTNKSARRNNGIGAVGRRRNAAREMTPVTPPGGAVNMMRCNGRRLAARCHGGARTERKHRHSNQGACDQRGAKSGREFARHSCTSQTLLVAGLLFIVVHNYCSVKAAVMGLVPLFEIKSPQWLRHSRTIGPDISTACQCANEPIKKSRCAGPSSKPRAISGRAVKVRRWAPRAA